MPRHPTLFTRAVYPNTLLKISISQNTNAVKNLVQISQSYTVKTPEPKNNKSHFACKTRKITGKIKMPSKKRTRNTPDSSLNESVVNPRSVRRVNSEETPVESCKDNTGHTSASGSELGGTPKHSSTAINWSQVSEDLILSDDPIIVNCASPPEVASAPVDALSISSNGTGSSFDSKLNGTLVSPPKDLKEIMDINCGRMEKMEISSHEAQNTKKNSTAYKSEPTHTNAIEKPSTSKGNKKKPFYSAELEDTTSLYGKNLQKIAINTQLITNLSPQFVAHKKRKMSTVKMSIYPATYPQHVVSQKMRDFLMEHVRLTLAAEVSKPARANQEANREETVSFGEERLRSGQLIVVCMNRKSAVWLNKTVKKIARKEEFQQFGAHTIKIKPVAEAEPKPTFTLWHSHSLITFEELKAEMRKHQGINTNGWKMLNETVITTGNGGVRFTFIGDSEFTKYFDEIKRERRFNHMLMRFPIYVRWQRSEADDEEGKNFEMCAKLYKKPHTLIFPMEFKTLRQRNWMQGWSSRLRKKKLEDVRKRWRLKSIRHWRTNPSNGRRHQYHMPTTTTVPKKASELEEMNNIINCDRSIATTTTALKTLSEHEEVNKIVNYRGSHRDINGVKVMFESINTGDMNHKSNKKCTVGITGVENSLIIEFKEPNIKMYGLSQRRKFKYPQLSDPLRETNLICTIKCEKYQRKNKLEMKCKKGNFLEKSWATQSVGTVRKLGNRKKTLVNRNDASWHDTQGRARVGEIVTLTNRAAGTIENKLGNGSVRSDTHFRPLIKELRTRMISLVAGKTMGLVTQCRDVVQQLETTTDGGKRDFWHFLHINERNRVATHAKRINITTFGDGRQTSFYGD